MPLSSSLGAVIRPAFHHPPIASTSTLLPSFLRPPKSRSFSSSSARPSPTASEKEPAYPGHVRINFLQQSILAVGSAVASLVNPSRHEMIAVLSETTGGPFLAALRTTMRSTPSGRSLLRERPRITEESVNLEKLALMPEGSLGRAYVDWLRKNKVTPDTRDPVKYIDDPELAYIMQRYRESHDFYHVLLGFGVSIPSELVVKWFELANFNLPVALLSSIFGPLRMESSERRRLMSTYGTWALKCGSQAKCLIGVEWEKEWEKDVGLLKKELGIWDPPVPFKEWRKEGRRLKKEAEEREARWKDRLERSRMDA